MSEAKIDEKRMAEIEARVRAATHGPWGHGEGVIGPYVDHMISGGGYLDPPDHEAVWLGGSVDEADRAFIAEARTDIPDLIADLRAARAEVERLYGENQMLKAEVARHEDADVARAVQAMGPSWQCSACAHVYRGRLHSKCQACGREGYYSGSVRSELLAKYDAEQAKRIRARRGES